MAKIFKRVKDGKIGHAKESCWALPKAKPLNAVDPRLSQLQSEYARKALEEFQKASSPVQSHAVGNQGVAMSSTTSSAPSTSVSQVARPLAGVTIKQLGALSVAEISKKQKMRPYLCNEGSVFGADGEDARLREGSYVVRSNVDSGAAVSVAPLGTFPDYPVVPPSPDNRLVLVAANNEEVEHYGEVRPIVVSEEGHLRELVFQVAGVNKILTSAAQICNKGYRIVLEAAGETSYIEDRENGDQFRLSQEDEVYVHYLHVIPFEKTLGFRGRLQQAGPGQPWA